MSVKQIILSKAQIRALEQMYDFMQQWNTQRNKKFVEGYHRVVLTSFSWSTAKALIRRGLIESSKNNEHNIRITPAGIAWLKAHEAEVRS